MIVGTVVPDLVAFITKRFTGIRAPANVNEHRPAIVIDNVIAHIVVVMAFVVVTTLSCNKQAIGAAGFIPRYHNLDTREPRIGRQWQALSRLLNFILHKQLKQVSEKMGPAHMPIIRLTIV